MTVGGARASAPPGTATRAPAKVTTAFCAPPIILATGARASKTPLTPARPTNTSAPYAPVPAGAAGPCTLAVDQFRQPVPSCDDRGDYLPVQVSLVPAAEPCGPRAAPTATRARSHACENPEIDPTQRFCRALMRACRCSAMRGRGGSALAGAAAPAARRWRAWYLTQRIEGAERPPWPGDSFGSPPTSFHWFCVRSHMEVTYRRLFLFTGR